MTSIFMHNPDKIEFEVFKKENDNIDFVILKFKQGRTEIYICFDTDNPNTVKARIDLAIENPTILHTQ